MSKIFKISLLTRNIFKNYLHAFIRSKNTSKREEISFGALSDMMALRSNIQTLESVLAELKKILKDVDVLVDVFLKPKR